MRTKTVPKTRFIRVTFRAPFIRLATAAAASDTPVITTGGVETLARIADALGEHGFDVHVDVLVVQGELHTIPFDLGEDGLETVDDLLRLVLLDDDRVPLRSKKRNAEPDKVCAAKKPDDKEEGR